MDSCPVSSVSDGSTARIKLEPSRTMASGPSILSWMERQLDHYIPLRVLSVMAQVVPPSIIAASMLPSAAAAASA